PFPGAAYFKPVHGCASAYVRRVTDVESLRKEIAAFDARGQDDPLWVRNYLDWAGTDFHLEQETVGELVSVEAMSRDGRFQPLGVLSRILFSRNPIVEMGSCFPYPHPRSRDVIDFVADVHAALGFSDGPSHVEVMIGADGSLE